MGGRDRDPGDGGGTRVRLSWFTWEGLACAVVSVTLCIVFGGERPTDDADDVALGRHRGMVETVRFSPVGEILVTSCWDGTVRLWDAGEAQEPFEREMASLPGGAEVYAATISPDGGTVAATGLQGLTIWNWRDPRSFPEVEARFGPCRATAFAPDGRTLAVGGFDGRIRIWDLKAHRVLAALDGHRDAIHTLAFTPDGATLASLDFAGSLRFWDLRSCREVDRFNGRAENVHAMSLSPDGRTIALTRFGASDRRIELWDLGSNAIRVVCPGHRAGVHALGFSGDGRTLVSAGGDQTLRFWNADTGQPRGELDGCYDSVRSIDVSRDGRWLAYSGGTYNQVHLRRINLPVAPAIGSRAL